MNGWLVAAAVLTAGLGLSGVAALRGGFGAAVVALEVAGTTACAALLLLAAGTGREAFADLAVAAALVTVTSGLLFARYTARRL